MKKSQLTSLIREELLSLIKEEEVQVGKIKVDKDRLKKATEKAEKGNSDELATIMALGGVVEEDVVDVDDKEAHKAAAKGTGGKEAKGFAAQTTAGLEAHKKREILQKFMRNMKGMGIVSKANKILDIAKYKEEFAKFKAKNL